MAQLSVKLLEVILGIVVIQNCKVNALQVAIVLQNDITEDLHRSKDNQAMLHLRLCAPRALPWQWSPVGCGMLHSQTLTAPHYHDP